MSRLCAILTLAALLGVALGGCATWLNPNCDFGEPDEAPCYCHRYQQQTGQGCPVQTDGGVKAQ